MELLTLKRKIHEAKEFRQLLKAGKGKEADSSEDPAEGTVTLIH